MSAKSGTDPRSAEKRQESAQQKGADPFFAVIGGKGVHAYRLENAGGMHCLISPYGARILSLHAPDRNGHFADVVLGHDALNDYLTYPDTFFGATVGRVANRTSGAAFTLNGKRYRLAANDGKHHLHGGPQGFHTKVWEILSAEKNRVVLGLESPDGEGGYPGRLRAEVTYTLDDSGALRIDKRARTDRDTPVNLTNHAYFNLRGPGASTVEDHRVQINADHFLPIDSDCIPTGELAPVAGTPFDLRRPAKIAERLAENHPQLGTARGFDHHYVCSGSGLRTVAEIAEPESGRTMEVLTDLPGMQFYTGNFLDGSVPGKDGLPAVFRSGMCFETQHRPDSLNKPEFPSILLKKGEVYASTCLYRFGVAP